MSDEEQRRWSELEAELSKQHRLVTLSRRIGVMPSPLIILWWAIGGTLGLAVIVSGAVVHNSDVLAAGVDSLTVIVVLTGIALILTGLSSARRQQRNSPGHQASSPGRGGR